MGWRRSERLNALPGYFQWVACGCDPFSAHRLSNDHLRSHSPECWSVDSFSSLTDLSLAACLNLLSAGWFLVLFEECRRILWAFGGSQGAR